MLSRRQRVKSAHRTCQTATNGIKTKGFPILGGLGKPLLESLWERKTYYEKNNTEKEEN
jgi:hypothetical protein